MNLEYVSLSKNHER